VPLIVYGRNEPVNIQASEFDAKRAISRAGGQLIELVIEGEKKSRMVLAREEQYDAISGVLLHADLYEVDMTETIQIDVPLSFVNEPKMVETGQAMLLQILNDVQIECLPGDIMQSIEVDVSGLDDFGAALYVSDLSLPEGISVLTPADDMIARLQGIQEEEEEEEEEEALLGEVDAGEVEVIQRGKAEEEEEE
jgi:large subunit ribosomal protein L25